MQILTPIKLVGYPLLKYTGFKLCLQPLASTVVRKGAPLMLLAKVAGSNPTWVICLRCFFFSLKYQVHIGVRVQHKIYLTWNWILIISIYKKVAIFIVGTNTVGLILIAAIGFRKGEMYDLLKAISLTLNDGYKFSLCKPMIFQWLQNWWKSYLNQV